VAAAFAGEPLRDRGASRAETNIELTYSVQVTPWLRLQPDIQYIFNPGLDEGLDNALVIGLRIELFKQVIW
jgi:porin